MNQMTFFQKAALDAYRSLTFITTYQCTAACRECCFESSPTLISNRLSNETMTKIVSEAKRAMPNLGLIVFSGGECFMLKEELFKTIDFVTAEGLKSRCVTNGFWGKTPQSALRIAQRLKQAGLSEINLSTGLEHQEWVPESSIINCAEALIGQGIFTLVTIEKDTEISGCWKSLAEHSAVRRFLRDHQGLFCLSSNAWMPFHADAAPRGPKQAPPKMACDQLFANLVVTPYQKLSACCGLTFEHIPEMHIGQVGETSLENAIKTVTEDFLKIWIHVDGPVEIVRKVGSMDDIRKIEETVHICQACAFLHQSVSVRQKIQERYTEFVPDVMARFAFGKVLRSMAGAAMNR